jgi:hypothetical protein
MIPDIVDKTNEADQHHRILKQVSIGNISHLHHPLSRGLGVKEALHSLILGANRLPK